ncbi:SDR family oxidoreductase [Croceicoccus mobilis]|uniref:Short-chain dehydrogenase n=1 Tax=Croceicoccus mobilis TaxID=1703339 RepID=A0A916Z6F8_9SPHN|nr:SDR family oxidoreductase [Croceicoccus mobilis]GGD78945.1 short-chain dehydrogenase [Croceicoccus mobilis]
MANVFITGAGRGIGFELARKHAAAGDRVFALVRDTTKSGDLTALADGSGGKVTIHRMDAGDLKAIPAAAAATGDDKVDILYNVAGNTGPLNNELETDIDWDGWDESFDLMVKGPLAVLKAFLPRMHEGSKVINFSSQLAASTWPYGGLYAYGAAKAALNRVMRSVAIDLKDKGIIVVTLHPGYVQTDMGGPNAEITPDESASGIHALSQSLTIEDSGDFFKWNGDRHPW